MERTQQISAWLQAQFPSDAFTLAPASADASFRRYFRVSFADGRSLIVMDAPPAHEDCRPWLKVQALLHGAKVNVPEVLAQDLECGFLLLSDLGSATYLASLSEETAPILYRQAIDALLDIQSADASGHLPVYDETLLRRELELFPEWYLGKHHGLTLTSEQRKSLDIVFERIIAVNLAEPQVFVHRDYHSRNLMVTENGPGVIDFQDAVFGPISYDLVSLFKDAYIAWDEAQILDWIIGYWEKARKRGLPVNPDFGEFHRDFEWMGLQRHLKVLGIFARLYHRDGKDGYLKDLPLVADYVRKTCERYEALGPLLRLLNQIEGKTRVLGYTL